MSNLDSSNEAEALHLYQELLSTPSPSGREAELAKKIDILVRGWGYETEFDNAGNLLVFVEGEGDAVNSPLVCYASHMDEIGFTISQILPNGRLKAFRRGGLYPWKMGEGPVEILTNSGGTIKGVLSMGAGHQLSADHGITWENVTIITGLSPEALAEAGVTNGAAGVMAREMCGPVLFGDSADPLVGSWTFDDKMGCVALLRLLKQIAAKELKPKSDTLFAFTTREEIGGFGARHLGLTRQPDVFIAVDGSPMPPSAGLMLDKPALWMNDRLAPYDVDLAERLIDCGRRLNIEVQRATYNVSASDASMVAQSGGTGRIACFGHPRENSHGFEVAKLSVFDDILEILALFLSEFEA
ncbi:MAG: M20/M25/M40 family metallo-hydrolase [Chloroflexota bacterium]